MPNWFGGGQDGSKAFLGLSPDAWQGVADAFQGAALIHQPGGAANLRYLQAMQEDRYRRQQEMAAQQQAERQQQVQNAAMRSLSQTSGLMTPETRQFQVNGRTIGQNRAAQPVVSEAQAMSMLQTAAPEVANSVIANRAMAAYAPPKKFSGTLSRGQLGFVEGQPVAQGLPEEPSAPTTRVRNLPNRMAQQQQWNPGTNDWDDVGAPYALDAAPTSAARDTFRVLTPTEAAERNLPPGGSYKLNLANNDVVAITQPRQDNARFNNDQNKAAGYANTMATAEKRIEKAIGKIGPDGKWQPGKYDPTGQWEGWSISNTTSSPEQQQYNQAKKEWGLAVLRFESGANVPDAEALTYAETFFPTIGDTEEAIQAKAEARRNKLSGIMAASGGAYNELFGASNGGTGRPAVGAIEDGYRFKGGDPSDPNNWERV